MNKINKNKSVSLLLGIGVTTICLSSCVKKETEHYETERLNATCSSEGTCEVDLEDANMLRTTNSLGHTTEKVLSTVPVDKKDYNLKWSASGGSWATPTQMEKLPGLKHCDDENCTATSNPTAFTFTGAHKYDIQTNTQTNINTNKCTQTMLHT